MNVSTLEHRTLLIFPLLPLQPSLYFLFPSLKYFTSFVFKTSSVNMDSTSRAIKSIAYSLSRILSSHSMNSVDLRHDDYLEAQDLHPVR